MVNVLDLRSSSPGSSPGWGHCIVFLGKILNSSSASLQPGVIIGEGKFNAEVTLEWTSIPSRRE